MHVSDFLSRHPDNDNDSPHEIIPIEFLGRDYLNIVTRSMTKKAKADVSGMYLLRGENRKPGKARKGIIDLTKSKENQKVEEKGKQRGEIGINNEEGGKIYDPIPIPVSRRDRIDIPTPQLFPEQGNQLFRNYFTTRKTERL